MLPMPLRHAWRSLRRTPAFTITAALTLVIGIGASVAMFEIVNGVLLKPLPYGDSNRLVGAWHDLPPINLHKAQQTSGTYFTYKKFAHTIENIGVYQDGSVNAAGVGGAEPQRLTAAFMTSTLVPTLGVSPLFGRVFTDAEDRPNGPFVVVISEGLWRTWFGADPKILDRTMDVNGHQRQIIGVMPARFRFPTAGTQIWLPLQLDPAQHLHGWVQLHRRREAQAGRESRRRGAGSRGRAAAHGRAVSKSRARHSDDDVAGAGQAEAHPRPD